MDEADRLSDRIAIIDHGKLLRLDTPSNLKKEIGEGDVVEMKLSNPALNQEVISVLRDLPDVHSVVEIDDGLNVRALDAVGKLPQIIGRVETTGVYVLDLSVRQNTLEDVFIDLTGTGLRE